MLKVRPKEFIHLNLVSNAAQEEEEEEVKSQCLLLQLHGDVAAIKKKRRPMEMEDIGISEDQSVAQHIFVSNEISQSHDRRLMRPAKTFLIRKVFAAHAPDFRLR